MDLYSVLETQPYSRVDFSARPVWMSLGVGFQSFIYILSAELNTSYNYETIIKHLIYPSEAGFTETQVPHPISG